MEKTALELFFNELERMQYFLGNYMLEAYKQAKEMEKQQQGYSEEQINELIRLLKQTTEYEVLQSFRDKVEQFKKK